MCLSTQASSSSSRHQSAGILHQKDRFGTTIASRRIFADQEIIVGRDKSRCQYVLNDPFVSNKHLRIYTVIYENDKPSEVAPLVYAEDLSRNGTFWNNSLIGKGNGGYLLSDGDSLRLSSGSWFTYEHFVLESTHEHFDLVQEQEMKSFRKDYVITDRLLGAGAFGKVFMSIEQYRRSQLACKVVDLRKLKPQKSIAIGRQEAPALAEDVDNRLQLRKIKIWADQREKKNHLEGKLQVYYREADILAGISHPNIVGLEKVFVTDSTIYIFQELITAGDLFSYLELKNGRLMDVEAAVIVRQILVALNFLHDKNIVHRDLKPDNILMTTLANGCRVVLTDFGAARKIANGRQRMSTTVGTVEYSAPEVLGHPRQSGGQRGYTKAVDMWALGCVTVVLLTGGSAFTDPSTDEYSKKLANECNLTTLEKSRDWKEVGSRPKAFVGKLLLLDAQTRMTASNALHDPWFSNDFHKTDFDELYKRTIKHWQPKVHQRPVIEFLDSNSVKYLQCSQEVLGSEKRSRARGQAPIEPPYKPFPRQMYQPFFPERRLAKLMMSAEVETAIKEKWTYSGSSSAGSDSESTPTKRPHGLGPRKRMLSAISNAGEKSKATANLTQPRKASFKPLQRKTPLTKVHTDQDGLPILPPANNHLDSISKQMDASAREEIISAFTQAVAPGEENIRPPTSRAEHAGRSDHTIPLRPLIGTETILNYPASVPGQAFLGDDYKAAPVLHESPQNRPLQVESDGPTRVTGEDLSEECEMFRTSWGSLVPLNTSCSQKPNTKLKLRAPTDIHSTTDQDKHGKKHRRISIYDFEDELNVEEISHELKRPKMMRRNLNPSSKRMDVSDSTSAPVIDAEAIVPPTPRDEPMEHAYKSC